MNELPLNLISSFLAAIGAVMAGLVTLLRSRRELRRDRVDLDKIAGALQAEESARKVAVLERVVERVPVGLTPEQFAMLTHEIAARLPAPIAAPSPVLNAVESLVNNYHEQALSQAKAQFWFSVAAATLGVVWILFAGAAIEPDEQRSAASIRR